MRISDWSSDVCSSDLTRAGRAHRLAAAGAGARRYRSHRHRGALASNYRLHAAGVAVLCAVLAEAGGMASQSSSLRSGAQGLAKRTRSRSEEHTSELQSLMRISYAVFCLKKKK